MSRSQKPKVIVRSGGITIMDSVDNDTDIDRNTHLNPITGARITTSHQVYNHHPSFEQLSKSEPYRNPLASTASTLMSASNKVSVFNSKPDMASSDNNGKPQASQPRYQGASVMMNIFAPYFPQLQHDILSNEGHPNPEETCACGSGEKIMYQCLECFGGHLMCKFCVIRAHKHHPFHRIRVWNGRHFEAQSLNDIGFSLPLGHHGDACPNRSQLKTKHGRLCVIGHTNGFHRLRVEFCQCHGSAPDFSQLTQSRLFPATIDHPETAFSFDLLDDWHIHTLTSKKSAHDYHDALRRLTDPLLPNKIPNRSQEFVRVSRIWRYLATQRRSGQFHAIDTILTTRRPGSVAIRCHACPQIGFNVSQDEIDAASEEDAHLYTLFISADGNFRWQRKSGKNEDPDDVALNEGNGYFVETKQYKQYLGLVDQSKDDAVCAHLRAVRLQNVVKFKNAAVSGVVSIQCARHGLFLPQGTVDLKNGEAFRNTDYALVNSLADEKSQRWVMMSYDIWCSYSKNLVSRVSDYFSHYKELIGKITGAVPKMHIRNHIDTCQHLFAFDYTPKTGKTYGEKIETSWAENNQAAGSTKEQNDGHRHDTLDDFMNFWNWNKTQGLAQSLYTSYSRVIEQLKISQTTFFKFNETQDKEDVRKWLATEMKPYRDNDGNVISPYQVSFTDGPPTQSQAYNDLVKSEQAIAHLRRQSLSGLAQLMNTGLDIEQMQLEIKNHPEDTSEDKLEPKRQILAKKLSEWRLAQLGRWPGLADYVLSDINTSETIEIEDLPLCLPSFFSPTTRSLLGLDQAGKAEYQLREGHAHEALEQLRTAIRTYNFNLNFKRAQVFGQRQNTRSQAFLKTLTDDKHRAADDYIHTRSRLLKLGLSLDDDTLQPLDKATQLFSKNYFTSTKTGDSAIRDPWYWHVKRALAPSKGKTHNKQLWAKEANRVKWFRDFADMTHCKEEKEMLEKEAERCGVSLTKMIEVWTLLAEASPAQSDGPGSIAYAHKQASAYGTLNSDCKDWLKKMLKDKSKYEEWLKEQKFQPLPVV